MLFLATLGFCLFFWGCCGFGGCRKCKRTRGPDFYREQFYANLRQVNNGAELIQMTSTMTSPEHDRYEYYKRHYYATKKKIHKIPTMTQIINMKPPNLKTIAQSNNMKPSNMKMK